MLRARQVRAGGPAPPTAVGGAEAPCARARLGEHAATAQAPPPPPPPTRYLGCPSPQSERWERREEPPEWSSAGCTAHSGARRTSRSLASQCRAVRNDPSAGATGQPHPPSTASGLRPRPAPRGTPRPHTHSHTHSRSLLHTPTDSISRQRLKSSSKKNNKYGKILKNERGSSPSAQT